jgi:hypothetical protein
MDEVLLQRVLDQLSSRRRAATYGAVAGVVGSIPQTVMADRPFNPRHSWVVNARTERPTRYGVSEMDSDLVGSIRANGIICTPEDLKDWLQ